MVVGYGNKLIVNDATMKAIAQQYVNHKTVGKSPVVTSVSYRSGEGFVISLEEPEAVDPENKQE